MPPWDYLGFDITGAFLNFRLAFWVSMEFHPVYGAVLLMEPFGVTINMVSLAFIVR